LAGQYYDEETGLHYNYHRYYNPATGRYLTPDPIGLEGGINLFLFVLNNPLIFIDPYGLVKACAQDCLDFCDLEYEEKKQQIYDWYINLDIEGVCGYSDSRTTTFCEATVHGTYLLRLKLAKKRHDQCEVDCLKLHDCDECP
jgi:RHS repeat-associated protein